MWRIRLGLKTVAFTIPATIATLDIVGYVASVEGASMQPTLNPNGKSKGDYVFLNRWTARNYKFERGEIVIVKCPRNPDQRLIKRIIALEDDTVKTLSYKKKFVRVPMGHCWVEGDHHGESMDSNFFGPVAVGLIEAKASHIVWPPNRWQALHTTSISSDRLVKGYYADNENSAVAEMDQALSNLTESNSLHVDADIVDR